MKFDMTRPCADCPFLRDRRFPLHPGRVRDIGGMMLEPRGGVFPCHKTVDYDRLREAEEEDEEDGFLSPDPGQQHCAGALAFALKNNNMTQMMRIEARTGWDPDAVEAASAGLVWDDLREWLKFARAEERARGASRRSLEPDD